MCHIDTQLFPLVVFVFESRLALFVNEAEMLINTAFPLFLCVYKSVDSCRQYLSTTTIPLI